ncbi:MAG: hypothetical protein IT457_19030 [Planctomycetes bacterium]|nr:hypothetical protein [Planctomycetota bacterium]
MSPSTCPGCSAVFESSDGPVHEYMESSPACWRAFGEVLAREYGSGEHFAVHRLTVDAYAVQHPGGDSRQAIQSVGVHLARLCMMLERSLSPERANAAMVRVSGIKARMVKLARPASLGAVTVADVLAARDAEEHVAAVRRWADAAWLAWSPHHATVRRWVDLAF